MPSLTVIPSGVTGVTGMTISSSYPITRAYHDSSNTSQYARYSISTSTTGYCYLTFNTSDIPSGATIESVTANARLRISSTSRVTNRVCQLYSGTTAKGTSVSFSSTSSGGAVVALSPGTGWTRANLNDLRMKIGGTGSSSSQSKYIYIYGADITITYSLGASYTVTVTCSASGIEASPASQDVYEGESAVITINGSSVDNITVTDNNTDVTSQIVRHDSESGSFTKSTIPTSFDSTHSSYASVYNNNNPENGLTNESSTTRCCVYSNTGSSAQSYLYYNFDVSDIPANATITSVSCVAKASCYSSGSYFATKELQLCTGTTAKGTAQTVTGNGSTGSTHTISGGSWTRAELDDIKIRFKIVRDTSDYTANASFSFFGATLTVAYTVTPENPYYWTYTISNVTADHTVVITGDAPTKTLYYKENGVWKTATSAYKKVNGSWVLQSNLSNVFQSGVNYRKGGS